MISSPGQRFLSDFRSAELELCSLQGSDALSVSLSQSASSPFLQLALGADLYFQSAGWVGDVFVPCAGKGRWAGLSHLFFPSWVWSLLAAGCIASSLGAFDFFRPCGLCGAVLFFSFSPGQQNL